MKKALLFIICGLLTVGIFGCSAAEPEKREENGFLVYETGGYDFFEKSDFPMEMVFADYTVSLEGYGVLEVTYEQGFNDILEYKLVFSDEVPEEDIPSIVENWISGEMRIENDESGLEIALEFDGSRGMNIYNNKVYYKTTLQDIGEHSLHGADISIAFAGTDADGNKVKYDYRGTIEGDMFRQLTEEEILTDEEARNICRTKEEYYQEQD